MFEGLQARGEINSIIAPDGEFRAGRARLEDIRRMPRERAGVDRRRDVRHLRRHGEQIPEGRLDEVPEAVYTIGARRTLVAQSEKECEGRGRKS